MEVLKTGLLYILVGQVLLFNAFSCPIFLPFLSSFHGAKLARHAPFKHGINTAFLFEIYIGESIFNPYTLSTILVRPLLLPN